MSISLAIFTYLNVWWIMLFLVVPFSVRTDGNASKVDYAAAPKALHWKKILTINSILSIVVTAAIALMIHTNLVSLKDFTGAS